MIPARLSPAEAHAICIALVAVDLAARAWRIRWILAGLGRRISFGEAFTLNAFGDAASALTPLRLAGEPARLAGMLRAGVPAAAAFVAIGLEVAVAWPVIVVTVVPLVWAFAPEWWSAAGPKLAASAGRAGPWLLAITVATIATGIFAHAISRRFRAPHALRRRPMARMLAYLRRMPAAPLVGSIPLTLLNLIARVGVLAALVLTLPEPPPLAEVLVGSFALLYAQLILPTPSGVGAVDFGFLAGAAGDLGGREALLLFVWRLYTNGVGIVIGISLALHAYGWPAVRGFFRRGAVPLPPA